GGVVGAGGGQVQGEHEVGVGGGVLVAGEVVVDGGVVVEDVDAPEALGGRLGGGPGAGLVGDVDARAQRGGAERRALGSHGARLLVADVGDHHVRALAREAQRVGPADALRSPRDDRDPVAEAHGG